MDRLHLVLSAREKVPIYKGQLAAPNDYVRDDPKPDNRRLKSPITPPTPWRVTVEVANFYLTNHRRRIDFPKFLP